MDLAKKLSSRDFGAANAFVSLISSITKPDQLALSKKNPLKSVFLELVRGY